MKQGRDADVLKKDAFDDDDEVAQWVEPVDELKPVGHVLNGRWESRQQNGGHHEAEDAKKGLLLGRADGGNQQAEPSQGQDIKNHAAIEQEQRTLKGDSINEDTGAENDSGL